MLVTVAGKLQQHLALCQLSQSKNGCCFTPAFQIWYRCPSWLTLTWNHAGEGIMGNVVPVDSTNCYILKNWERNKGNSYRVGSLEADTETVRDT